MQSKVQFKKPPKKVVRRSHNLVKHEIPRRSLRLSSQLKGENLVNSQQSKTLPASACKKLQKKKVLKKIPEMVMHRPLKLRKHGAKDNDDSFSPIKVYIKVKKSKSTARRMKCYGCKMCSFKTGYSESLKRHVIAKHKKTRKFKCDLCSYAATLKQGIVRHMDGVHLNIMRFQCNLCPYKTVQQSNVKRHIEIVHEGKKPFQCEQCGFRSAQKSHIKKHVVAVHEKKRDFMCSFCTYCSASKQNLTRHIKSLHNFK